MFGYVPFVVSFFVFSLFVWIFFFLQNYIEIYERKWVLLLKNVFVTMCCLCCFITTVNDFMRLKKVSSPTIFVCRWILFAYTIHNGIGRKGSIGNNHMHPYAWMRKTLHVQAGDEISCSIHTTAFLFVSETSAIWTRHIFCLSHSLSFDASTFCPHIYLRIFKLISIRFMVWIFVCLYY